MPATSDGPLFVAVRVTTPEVPGVIVGVDTDTATSARGAVATTESGVMVLFAVAGSALVDVTEAEPPVMLPAAWSAGTARMRTVDVVDPLATSPATVQVTVPLVSVQPFGRVPTVTPVGGV